MGPGGTDLIARAGWLTRLWKGGLIVSPLEAGLVHRFVDEMPLEFRSPLEAQIRSANLIQRDPDWIELRFYTMVDGSVNRSSLPPLPVHQGEVKLLSIAYHVGDGETRHATFWSVDRQFVMVNFDRSIEVVRHHRDFEVVRVRQSWRSNLEPGSRQPGKE